jgi:glycosyltransferase involved in cell wall biosynthesis
MSQTKASIIVPCYKVEKYLPRCLDSLTAQTLHDIEIICINDGSPDRCIDILRSYKNKFPNLITVIDKQNEGVWRGRLDAIKIAKGKYIGFVDSDDFVKPDFAEKLYTTAETNQADIAICGFHRVDVATGKILTTEITEPRQPFQVEEEPPRLLELNGAPWNKFFKAEILKDLYDFKNPPKIFDDIMLHLLTYPNVKKVAFTPDPLVYYIIRDDSIMTTIDQSKLDSAYNAMLEVKQFYKKTAPNQLFEFLDTAAFIHLGISLMFRISYDKKANLKKELHRNKQYLNEHFSTWKTNNILSSSNARHYGGAVKKAYYGKKIYQAGLMNVALGAYRLLIKHGIDIKW